MFTVGICGASGSGKTTLAEALVQRLGARCVYLKQDHYYRDHSYLSYEERCKINYDEPDAFENDLLFEDISDLRAGRSITAKGYDFTEHCRADTGERVVPAEVLVLEGIHAFYDPRVRELLDLKIFIDVDPDVCVVRRFKRDIRDRGRDVESVAKQYLTSVKPMFDKYIRSYSQYADVILANGGKNPKFIDMAMLYIDSVTKEGKLL